jgi:hypothetical protein
MCFRKLGGIMHCYIKTLILWKRKEEIPRIALAISHDLLNNTSYLRTQIAVQLTVITPF